MPFMPIGGRRDGVAVQKEYPPQLKMVGTRACAQVALSPNLQRAPPGAPAGQTPEVSLAADAAAADEEDEEAVGSSGYERDTSAPEEEDLIALLMPEGGTLPQHCAGVFSLSYSAAAMRGWVKQSSPACAAASLAGAWNALLGLHRSAQGAMGQEDVLVVMRANLEEAIRRKREKAPALGFLSLGYAHRLTTRCTPPLCSHPDRAATRRTLRANRCGASRGGDEGGQGPRATQ